jgi:hypothetical protein
MDIFFSVFGNGQEYDSETIELVRNLGVVSWKGKLFFRNNESYKIFTD